MVGYDWQIYFVSQHMGQIVSFAMGSKAFSNYNARIALNFWFMLILKKVTKIMWKLLAKSHDGQNMDHRNQTQQVRLLYIIHIVHCFYYWYVSGIVVVDVCVCTLPLSCSILLREESFFMSLAHSQSSLRSEVRGQGCSHSNTVSNLLWPGLI